MTDPLRFCFGVHLHQPVGNFDSVFEQHVQDVYRPFLDTMMAGEGWPLAMHLSGPLLEWLERHATSLVDDIGRHVSEGRLELLAAGHDEPILAVLPRADRLEQIARHREHLRGRFGVDITGLWLTERVWEPGLPEELAQAGIRFVLVDDRHFIVTGVDRDTLHAPFMTESGGRRVAVLPIDEKLRYLVPFRPPEELRDYLRQLRSAGQPLAILADDGEKFGGWPGTKSSVYGEKWLERFLATLRELRDRGEVTLSRFDQAVNHTPSRGLVYLPSASYREMEGWSLPPGPARALLTIEHAWGTARLAETDGGLLRGGHWRHFLVKYPESNRMHKLMLALSALSRERGDPLHVRAAIGKAQCNDAYWHGVFGGLYLPFLRGAIWQHLAEAEAMLRHGESLDIEALDFDADGAHELWLHSSRWSVLIEPARGGAIAFWLDLARRRNAVNVLTRHREAYHEPLPFDHAPVVTDLDAGATPSIHDLETQLTERPAFDNEIRALFVDRVVAASVTPDLFVAGTVPVLRSWANVALVDDWTRSGDHLAISLLGDGLRKSYRFDDDGTLRCEWQWNPAAMGSDDDWFTTELSHSEALLIDAPGAITWSYAIETVAKSEKGFDRTVQGTATVLLWPVRLGRAEVVVRLGE